IPTHESEQRRRLSPPVARAAPPASPRPFPQPDPSPQSPSSATSLCRVLACKVPAPSFVAVPCQFHSGIVSVILKSLGLQPRSVLCAEVSLVQTSNESSRASETGPNSYTRQAI